MDHNLGGYDVTTEQQSYYRLLIAIHHADLRSYYEAFGWAEINEGDAYDAKHELGWGELTAFEKQVIRFINNEIERKEFHDRSQKSLVRTSSYSH